MWRGDWLPKATTLNCAAKATRRELSARRRIALGVGGVGTFVLALSVSHCTDALVTLTGSSVWLAGLLAVGIDVGMVACEVATAVAGKSARQWGKWYVGLAVVLSMVLNALASAPPRLLQRVVREGRVLTPQPLVDLNATLVVQERLLRSGTLMVTSLLLLVTLAQR
jgi:hypothetical protein